MKNLENYIARLSKLAKLLALDKPACPSGLSPQDESRQAGSGFVRQSQVFNPRLAQILTKFFKARIIYFNPLLVDEIKLATKLVVDNFDEF
jgi:hypothetical protein